MTADAAAAAAISSSNMEAFVDQASDVNGQLLVLMCIAFVLGLGKGGVPGFATVAVAATVLTAPSSIPSGLAYAVSLQVPILMMIDIYAAYLHSSSLDWPTVWLLLPVSFVGMAVGQVLDRHASDAAARVMVGCILLAILVLRVWKQVLTTLFPRWARRKWGRETLSRKESDLPLSHSSSTVETSNVVTAAAAQQRKSAWAWACIVGLVGGAATMLTNSMGPILNVYLLSVRKLPPSAYVGTRAMIFCFLNVGKIPMRFMSGTLGLPMLPLATGLGLISILGVFCAKPIMLSMSEQTFVKLELAVVAFAGLRLCWTGLTTMYA